MRVLLQRVLEASVTVESQPGAAVPQEVIGRIGPGLLLLVGIGDEDVKDSGAALKPLAAKIVNLRIFADGGHNMNKSLLESGGAVLAVSQFTLHADCRRGRRPGFSHAAPPEIARAMFDQFVAELKACGVRIETGRFGAMMQVALVNDGPVTIWLNSREALAGSQA